MTTPTVDRICRNCEAPFKCTNTQVKNNQGIYCSFKCRNIGRTRSVEDRFWKHVRKTDKCWFWTASTDEHGYGQINVGGKPERAHRLSYQLHYGPLPKETPCALHQCDTPLCVRPDHLFPGTRKTNILDKVAKQRQSRGTGRPSAKLNESTINEIRMDASNGVTQKVLAEKHAVSQPLISRIVSRKIWKHI